MRRCYKVPCHMSTLGSAARLKASSKLVVLDIVQYSPPFLFQGLTAVLTDILRPPVGPHMLDLAIGIELEHINRANRHLLHHAVEAEGN